MSLRIVFMGTPDFAVPSLRILVDSGYQIVAVITATDKLGGRGGKQVLESAVKRYAIAQGLHVLQPPNLKNPEFISSLAALKADLQVVVAFRMLPEIVWNMPPMGTINLHGSLLPAYRGAAPINWAIINGEKQTGVTTFMLKHEIDTGNILIQRSMPIGPNDTAGDIHDLMMDIGAKAVLDSVAGLESGTLEGLLQDADQVSHAPKINHDMCRIRFDQSAEVVHNFIRGLSPYPTAWTILDGIQLNVYRSEILDETVELESGSVISTAEGLDVSCGRGIIRLEEVQLAGKRRMTAAEFLNGYKMRSTILGLEA